MMEAANKGASQANGKSIALGISLPFEQGVNEFASPELSFEFHYFFLRKFYFLYHAKMVVVFPGGFGTMDELFETFDSHSNEKAEQRSANHTFWKGILGRINKF